ncbi:MAG TPA: aminopeptidase P N-terminal domain-containing protein, partial [Rhodothermales bacterium]|nr:aminopeptidase P N-terminal domain-containing protein [Rhodothermales bacterium]
MKRLFFLLLALLVSIPVFAQPTIPDYPARYDVGLSAAFTKNRREAVIAKLPPDALALFLNNPLRNRSNDTDFEYQPDRNTYYLTGSHEEGTFLLLAPAGVEVDGKTVKEILFVPPRNPQTETWNGRLFGADRAIKELGVALAIDNTRFEEVVGKLLDSNKFKIYHMPFQDGLEGADAPNPRWMPIITK